MATTYPVRSFSYGELSQKFAGRIDSPFYAQGCRRLHNMFGLPIGPAEKRPGTIYAASGKTAGKKVILIPWIISPNEGRMLEFGHNYIRYYKDGEQIPDTETETTYTESDLPYIRVKQITSFMYINCVGFQQAKLTRTSDTSWALTDVTNTAGAGEEDFSSNFPALIEFYENRKIHAKTPTKKSTFWGSRVAQFDNFSLRTSATITVTIASPGVVTWTAHGLTANVGVVFSTTGALPTGLLPGVVYYVVGASITTDTFQVSAAPGGAAINTSVSQSGVHTGFASPALATDAWEKTPYVQNNAEILWLLAGDALLYGTSDGPFRVGGKEQILTGDGAWWPQRQAAVGCSDVPAIMVDEFACFVGKSGKRLYRFEYQQANDKYIPDDITFLAEHITGAGVSGMVHQREPSTIIWGWTADGKLLTGVYSRTTQTIAWSDHDISGLVEAVAVIPTATEDQVWVSVARTIGADVIRHIEYFAAREWVLTRDYQGTDGAVVWDGGDAVDATSITAANPAVCTATTHGFLDDELVRFSGVTGILAVNGEVYTVKNKTDHTFQLYTRDGSTPIDFSGEGAPGAGGTVEQVTNIVTGLTHLQGETVKTLGDGSTIADEVVAGGQVTLDEYANKIRTGLGFTSILEPMDIAEARNRLKRVTKVFAQFYKTVDAQVSDGVATPRQITFPGEPMMDEAPEARTEGIKELFDGYADYKGRIRIESSNPLPQTVLAVTYELVVGT